MNKETETNKNIVAASIEMTAMSTANQIAAINRHPPKYLPSDFMNLIKKYKLETDDA